MKKSLKYIISVFVFLFIGLIIIFQNRITGTYELYRLITEVTRSISNGSDNYSLHLAAGIRTDDHADTLHAFISYRKDSHFKADVAYNQNTYSIFHDQDSTSVYISDPGLLVSGKGADNGKFHPREHSDVLFVYHSPCLQRREASAQ